jgi:hypothetical protein
MEKSPGLSGVDFPQETNPLNGTFRYPIDEITNPLVVEH